MLVDEAFSKIRSEDEVPAVFDWLLRIIACTVELEELAISKGEPYCKSPAPPTDRLSMMLGADAVEDAYRPPNNESRVEVALVLMPKFVVGVKGKELPEPDPQATPVEVSTALLHVAHPSERPVLVSDEPEGMTMLPVESIVVVAVAPKYALVRLENWVVEALGLMIREGKDSTTAPVEALALIWLAVPDILVTPVLVMVSEPPIAARPAVTAMPEPLDIVPVATPPSVAGVPFVDV